MFIAKIYDSESQKVSTGSGSSFKPSKYRTADGYKE